jgi:hypothetical protein
MERKGTSEWKWKENAILPFAKDLREATNPEFLKIATLVPMPPSKRRDDPLHDDRMLRILRAMAGSDKCDIRELVSMRANLEPALSNRACLSGPFRHPSQIWRSNS